MVLTQDEPHRLGFEFSSLLWGCISFLVSGALGIATYFAFLEEDANGFILFILGLFTGLFFYAAVYSFSLRRILEIDDRQRVVKYRQSSLYQNISWQKPFGAFKAIKAFRLQSTATSSGGRRAINWTIQLISVENEKYEIGYNQFGAMSREQAEKLVNLIAMIMDVKQEMGEK